MRGCEEVRVWQIWFVERKWREVVKRGFKSVEDASETSIGGMF